MSQLYVAVASDRADEWSSYTIKLQGLVHTLGPLDLTTPDRVDVTGLSDPNNLKTTSDRSLPGTGNFILLLRSFF